MPRVRRKLRLPGIAKWQRYGSMRRTGMKVQPQQLTYCLDDSTVIVVAATDDGWAARVEDTSGNITKVHNRRFHAASAAIKFLQGIYNDA